MSPLQNQAHHDANKSRITVYLRDYNPIITNTGAIALKKHERKTFEI